MAAPESVNGSPAFMPRFTTASQSRSTSTAAAAKNSPVTSPIATVLQNVPAVKACSSRRPSNRTEPLDGA